MRITKPKYYMRDEYRPYKDIEVGKIQGGNKMGEKTEKPMIEEKDWEEFRSSGMLWWINRILHTFGWAIVFDYENTPLGEGPPKLKNVFPARCRFRGFGETQEDEGFENVTKYLKDNIEELDKEVNE